MRTSFEKDMTLLENLNESDRFANCSGMRIVEILPDSATAEMTVCPCHINGAGVCQGGALYTLADLAMAGVMNACGKVTLSIENTITYHHSARLGEHLTAVATMIFDHHKIPYCRSEIFNDEGTLVATLASMGYRKSAEFPFDALM